MMECGGGGRRVGTGRDVMQYICVHLRTCVSVGVYVRVCVCVCVKQQTPSRNQAVFVGGGRSVT